MSQRDSDLIRDHYAATNEGDFQRAMRYYADDVVLVVPGNGDVRSGNFEGKQAVGEWFGDWFRAFAPGYRFEIEEIRDLRPGLVFLHASHGGRGRASGAEVRGENAYLYCVADRRITRVGFYATPEEALEAASLPEWSGAETD